MQFLWRKHAQAVELMTEKKVNGMVLFLLWLVIAPVAIIVTQMELNKRAGEALATAEAPPPSPEEPPAASEEAAASSEEPPASSEETSTDKQE